MKTLVMGILCLLPVCSFAQGGKGLGPGLFGGKMPKQFSSRSGFSASLSPYIQRQANRSFLWNKRVEKVFPPSFPSYTKTRIPEFGTIYSFSKMPTDFMIATKDALVDLPASAKVWQDGDLFLSSLQAGQTFTTNIVDFMETQQPGVGTIRSYRDKPDFYSLQVPTRRGHMEHFVHMNMQGIVSRLVNYTRQQNLAESWMKIGGEMLYNDIEPLAERLHQLYRGQGISVKDPEGEEAIFYMLPVDGITFRLTDGMIPLKMTEHVVLFYPQHKSSQLLEQTKEGLGKFRLLGKEPTISQE